MKVPETYEEFLKTPKEILKDIISSELSLNDAKRLFKFNQRAKEEQLNLITKNKKVLLKNTLWEELRKDNY